MPSSPTTPSRKRRSLRLSNIDASRDSISTNTSSGGMNATASSRRSRNSSQSSFQPTSPLTPRPMSSASNKFSLHRRRSSRASIGSTLSIENYTGNGLENLADELGEVWDDEVAYHQGSSFLEGLREGSEDLGPASPATQDASFAVSDIHGGMSMQSPTYLSHDQSLHPPTKEDRLSGNADNPHRNGHEQAESCYDGSDYGPESDPDDAEFPPLLAKRIRDVEKVTRMSSNPSDALSEDGGVILRTYNALKDLGPQSSIENGTTRLITAYTSMATHRTHKTRELFTQAHSMLYGNVSNLPEETIDSLLAELIALSDSTNLKNITPQSPLLSLQILLANTSDLMNTLRSLSDVLQESRLASNLAARKLKAVREMVEEIRFEEELTEMSIMLIQAGDWDRRCRERNAATMCREVVSGFSQTCDLVRERYIMELEMELGLKLRSVRHEWIWMNDAQRDTPAFVDVICCSDEKYGSQNRWQP